MTYQHQFFVVRAINRIKSYVLGIENFLLSVLSLLSALKSSFFLSDLSELSGEISGSNLIPQVSFFLNSILGICANNINYKLSTALKISTTFST